jgi:hypothetical protein
LGKGWGLGLRAGLGAERDAGASIDAPAVRRRRLRRRFTWRGLCAHARRFEVEVRGSGIGGAHARTLVHVGAWVPTSSARVHGGVLRALLREWGRWGRGLTVVPPPLLLLLLSPSFLFLPLPLPLPPLPRPPLTFHYPCGYAKPISQSGFASAGGKGRGWGGGTGWHGGVTWRVGRCLGACQAVR